MALWAKRPRSLQGSWAAYRQVATGWPPLFHSAGEAIPSQESGRWHRQGEGYAQYFSLSPAGAWAEYLRHQSITDASRALEQRRDLWVAHVTATAIADLSSAKHLRQCGLSPEVATGLREDSQVLADDLRAAGFDGLLSRSAALEDEVNLTIFGERFERVVTQDPSRWQNPDPTIWIPCMMVAEASPPPLSILGEVIHSSG